MFTLEFVQHVNCAVTKPVLFNSSLFNLFYSTHPEIDESAYCHSSLFGQFVYQTCYWFFIRTSQNFLCSMVIQKRNGQKNHMNLILANSAHDHFQLSFSLTLLRLVPFKLIQPPTHPTVKVSFQPNQLGNHPKGPGFKPQSDYQSMTITMFRTLLCWSSPIQQ